MSPGPLSRQSPPSPPLDIIPLLFPGEPPFIDVPALKFTWEQQIQFYEEDEKTVIGKISWVDKNGMHFGMTSRQESIPVAMAASEKVSI